VVAWLGGWVDGWVVWMGGWMCDYRDGWMVHVHVKSICMEKEKK